MGAKCIGASDSKGSIIVPNGFKVSKLIEHKQKKGSVVGFPSKKVSTEQLLTTKREILIPMHLKIKLMLNLQKNYNVELLEKQQTVQHYLKQIQSFTTKIMVIPDILANSGGVCISYLEWVQNKWDITGALMKLQENGSKYSKSLKDTQIFPKNTKLI